MKFTKRASLFLSAFVLVIISVLSIISVRSQLRATNEISGNLGLEVFQESGGWGYSILLHDKIIIKQDIIPAIQESIPFRSETDAHKTGTLVIWKLKNHQHPTISLQEIDSLKIEI